MASLVRRIQRTKTRRKPSGIPHLGTKLGLHRELKPVKRAPRGSRRRTKPSTWRSKAA
jgi:hypothetical protein